MKVDKPIDFTKVFDHTWEVLDEVNLSDHPAIHYYGYGDDFMPPESWAFSYRQLDKEGNPTGRHLFFYSHIERVLGEFWAVRYNTLHGNPEKGEGPYSTSAICREPVVDGPFEDYDEARDFMVNKMMLRYDDPIYRDMGVPNNAEFILNAVAQAFELNGE